jgi:hypothetical protein
MATLTVRPRSDRFGRIQEKPCAGRPSRRSLRRSGDDSRRSVPSNELKGLLEAPDDRDASAATAGQGGGPPRRARRAGAATLLRASGDSEGTAAASAAASAATSHGIRGSNHDQHRQEPDEQAHQQPSSDAPRSARPSPRLPQFQHSRLSQKRRPLSQQRVLLRCAPSRRRRPEAGSQGRHHRPARFGRFSIVRLWWLFGSREGKRSPASGPTPAATDRAPPGTRPQRLPTLVQQTPTAQLAASPAADQPRLTPLWSRQLAPEFYALRMREVSLRVDGYPSAKNEAKSMLAAGHLYADRVLLLLRTAREAVGAGPQLVDGRQRVARRVVVEVAPTRSSRRKRCEGPRWRARRSSSLI